MQPSNIRQPRPAVGRHRSHVQDRIKYITFREDHQQLAAAVNGAVFIISQPSTSRHTKVTLHKDFKPCKYPAPFRSTSPPFASTDKLYLGARMKADARSVVLVTRTTDLQFLHSFQSNRRGREDWEYTFLALSSTGTVLYCGCSDGAIEVWNQGRKPGHERVYGQALTKHVGRILSLAVGQDGTLVSADEKETNVVRIWRSLNQVATLNLGHEKVCRMVSTPNKNLYVGTEAGSKLWCDLNRVLAPVEPRTQPTNRRTPSYGLECFNSLQEPSRGQTTANSCRAVGGVSNSVCFLCFPSPGHDTFSVEEWRGGEFVMSVDTTLRAYEAWIVSKHGTLYFSSRSTAH